MGNTAGDRGDTAGMGDTVGTRWEARWQIQWETEWKTRFPASYMPGIIQIGKQMKGVK